MMTFLCKRCGALKRRQSTIHASLCCDRETVLLRKAHLEAARGDLWASMRGARAKGVFRRRGAKWSSAPLPPSFSNQVALTAVADSADRVWLGFPGNRLVLITAEDIVHVYSQEIGLHVGSVKSPASGPSASERP